MTYPQQPSDPQYQQPQYQQPMYPPPAAAQPAPQTGTSIDFSSLSRPENRPYLIAGVGALVALIAYFFLPFFGESYSSSSPLTGSSSGSYSLTGSQLASAYPLLNLVWLAALVALVVAALLALGIRAIPQLTVQLGTRIILGAGIFALVFLGIGVLQVNGDLGKLNELNALASLAGGHFSIGISWGFFIALLAGIAVVVGGVMQMRRPQMM